MRRPSKNPTLLWLVLLGTIGASTALAQDEVARRDEAALLFSNRLLFSEDRQPMVPIGLMDRQDRIQIQTSGGLVIHPSGPDGPLVTVAGEGIWTVDTQAVTPAVVEWVVILEAVPTRDFTALRAARARWRERLEGDLGQMETGTVFGFFGKTLDTREILLLAPERHGSGAAAAQAAKALSAAHGAECRSTQVVKSRPRGTIRLRSADRGVTITAQDAIWFAPADGDTLTIKQVEYGRGFRWHGREDRTYAGRFYIAVDAAGKLAVANLLPAEKLLAGLVPAEMYSSAPLEALKAQAVAARNELLSKIGRRHLADPYLICGDQHCQVYKGSKAEKPRATRAVTETRGRLLFHGDRLADCRYHSNSGGHTEDSEEVWEGVESAELRGRWDLRSTPPALDLTTEAGAATFLARPPHSWAAESGKAGSTLRWTERLAPDKLDALVKEQGVGHVKALVPLHRGSSGRINHLELQGTRKTVPIKGELVIRLLLGGLKSSAFVVTSPGEDPKGDWVLSGGGFGHGVGMCQNGAMGMAEHGRTFIDILEHYYQNVSVETIY
ncbi:MAG: SpoIID/LytB domain-containing protein [Pseudomonadota bacterium]